MTSRQIRKTVRYEGIFPGMAGILVGLSVGTAFAYALAPDGFYLTFEYNGYQANDAAVPFDREQAAILEQARREGEQFDYDRMGRTERSSSTTTVSRRRSTAGVLSPAIR